MRDSGKIIYVKADSEVRVKRLVSSRGWTEQQARERLFSQDTEPNDENVIIIKNNGSLEELENIEVKMWICG